MMGRVEGKVAIVTGAGREGNIGVAVCRALLREGAKAVIGTDMRADQAQAISDSVAADGHAGAFRLVQQDVTSEADWQRVIGDTVAQFGQLDVLVNNAGLSIHGGVLNTSLEDLRTVMAVNHDALFLGIKYATPHLASAVERFEGGGSIINNLSMASYMPNANNIGYHVSKSAGRMLTICAAQELGSKRIRVNSIHPGMTMTPILREGFEDYVRQGLWESTEAAEAALAAMGPLGISSQPEDTAHAFVYLASDESRFMTGASIYHDGAIGLRY
ncbi:putative cyclopentanol dehydrogenase [Caenibius tardaugens NBRC 16725]|uniref:Putative cyclopentanol dehydrogenase n=2 Tax=Caenibius TaxID=2827482 RepID=U2ZZE6_9SPHN|nr:putative cyclopentanol dehydrogenase [Caenibius tardaugens NBRC 16725]